MKLDVLKSEIGHILDRYHIPLDDKSFVLEKIDGQLSSFVESVQSHLQGEQEKVKGTLGEMRDKAQVAIQNTVAKGQDAIKQAYHMGLKEGLAQTDKTQTTKPGWFQIAVTGGVLVLAAFIIVKEFFPRRDR